MAKKTRSKLAKAPSKKTKAKRASTIKHRVRVRQTNTKKIPLWLDTAVLDAARTQATARKITTREYLQELVATAVRSIAEALTVMTDAAADAAGEDAVGEDELTSALELNTRTALDTVLQPTPAAAVAIRPSYDTSQLRVTASAVIVPASVVVRDSTEQ